MTAYTTAVLRCDHQDCIANIEGDSVADCRRKAKAWGWTRTVLSTFWNTRKWGDLCPSHSGSSTPHSAADP